MIPAPTTCSCKLLLRVELGVDWLNVAGYVLFLFLFCFFPIPLLSSPFFPLSLLVVAQIRGPIAGSSFPYPLGFVPCIFIAKIFQLFLPSSTRVELCLPTLGPLSSWSLFLFLQIHSKSHYDAIRTPGRTLLIVLLLLRGGICYK